MSFADASCILKIDFHCESCRMKLLEVLSSVIGVYDFQCDGKYVKITGEIEPNRLLKAVARTGTHAKIIKASIRHPNYDPYTSSPLDYPYPAHGFVGMHDGADPFHGGYGYGFIDPFHGGPGFAAMHGGGAPFHGGPGFYGMNGGGMHHPCGGFEFGEDYPLRPTGHGFHHGRHPAMGAGFGGPWQPPHAFGGGPWF